MAIRYLCLFAIFSAMSVCGPARAEDSVKQIERLSSVIADSNYGEISRTQAILLIVCDQPGLSKGLEKPKASALLDLMEQKKVVWATGDTPEMMHVLATVMSVSFIQGLSMFASDDTNTGKAIKAATCRSAIKKTDSFMAAGS